MMRAHGGRRFIPLTIAANQTAVYNVFTAAGSPTDIVDVLLVVNSAIEVRNGLVTGTFPAGSTLYIINNGIIAGIGGVGGRGANWMNGDTTVAANGGAGGDAISLGMSVTIDNTSGSIFGGGGGGGGGEAGGNSAVPFAGDPTTCGGGGGGGGKKYNSGANFGAAGQAELGGTHNGSPGTSGTSAAVGTGGARGANGIYAGFGGNGGNGGDWGASGQQGSVSTGLNFGNGFGLGGAPGAAVRRNNALNTVTWVAGNNSTQVKGAVAI